VQPAFLFVKLQDLVNHVLPECVGVRILDTGEPGGQVATAGDFTGRTSGKAGRNARFPNASRRSKGASAQEPNGTVSAALLPITLSFTGQPFVRTADPTIVAQLGVPGCAQGNFVPGVIEFGGGVAAAGQQLTCTSHITLGEAHYFCPPECQGHDVCQYHKIGAPLFCSQPPAFPDAMLGPDCVGGFCLLPVTAKSKTCPGGGSAIQFYGGASCVSRESTCKGACCTDQGGCTLSSAALCDCAYKGDGTDCSSVACGKGPACCTVCPGHINPEDECCVDISLFGGGVSVTLDECPEAYREAKNPIPPKCRTDGGTVDCNGCSGAPENPNCTDIITGWDCPIPPHLGCECWGPFFTPACNDHDIAWSTCNKSKTEANNEFHAKLVQICSNHPYSDLTYGIYPFIGTLTVDQQLQKCKDNAQKYYECVEGINCYGLWLVNKLPAEFYKEGQRDACDCCGLCIP